MLVTPRLLHSSLFPLPPPPPLQTLPALSWDCYNIMILKTPKWPPPSPFDHTRSASYTRARMIGSVIKHNTGLVHQNCQWFAFGRKPRFLTLTPHQLLRAAPVCISGLIPFQLLLTQPSWLSFYSGRPALSDPWAVWFFLCLGCGGQLCGWLDSVDKLVSNEMSLLRVSSCY